MTAKLPTCLLLGIGVLAVCGSCGHGPTVPVERAFADSKKFKDPKPPQVTAAKGDAAKPRPHPDVTFHRKPKPLHPDAATHDWKSFLGPNHNATSTETHLRKDFPASGPPLLWEMRKGTSYTSPAISGDHLVYLHRVGNEERVECLHPETGEMYWQFAYPTTFSDRYGYNNGPRASPVIDGDRVYTYSALGKLHCFALASGELLWARDIAKEFKVPQDFFGTSSTPLIEGDLLILNVGAPGGPTVAAFDKQTGKMAWGSGDQWGASYASPVPATVHGKRRVFVFAGGESRPPTGGLLSLDPLSGKIDFAFPWRSRSFESVNASSPVIVGNQVLVSASYRTGAALLDILPNGSREVAWTERSFDLHWNTAIHKDGYLYGFPGRNEPDAALACIDLKTGTEQWRTVLEWPETVESRGRARTLAESTFRGSLLWADGRFLALGEHGHLLWLDLTPEGHKELARAWLFRARETWGLPVLSRGLLYLTQNTKEFLGDKPPRLLCYDLRGGE
jgi:outer membrane protein assembly factor BamB